MLAIAPFKNFERSAYLPIEPSEFFLSLVPTQLQRLMRSPDHRRVLAQFRAVLLGGAPAWEELLEEGRSHGIPLAPTYGMTETASQVVTLTPERFLQGHTSVGQVLPHARVKLVERNSCTDMDGFQQRFTPSEGEQRCAPAEDNDATRGSGDAASGTNVGMGRIEIQSESLGLGYYPDSFFNGIFRPDDVGYWDDQGELHIVGRSSDKMISGGENIFPGEVEAAIRTTGLVRDVAVLGMGDRHWGEIVTALYVPAHDAVTAEHLKQQISGHLSRYKHPKRWIPVKAIPRNAQGKINRMELQEMAIAHWHESSHQSSFQR
jgi:O-succinylbenzoic acid--CoA ligase